MSSANPASASATTYHHPSYPDPPPPPPRATTDTQSDPSPSTIRSPSRLALDVGNGKYGLPNTQPSQQSRAASTSAFANLFDNHTALTSDRRDSLALPRIETADAAQQLAASAASSRSSSPYISPRLPPKARQGGIGSMGGSEITLPPLSSAVPMRRGAVSGESSGPSLPFPPIRLPNTSEDDIPSRGPSPTLGKRPSFSLGHSNHVPPGPNAHLPMPALVGGSIDRRGATPGGSQPSSSFQHQGEGANSGEYSRTGAIRMSDDGTGYYYTSQAGIANGAAPRSMTSSQTYPTFNGRRGDSGGEEGQASYSYASTMGRQSNGGEDPYYNHHPHAVGHGAPNGFQHPAARYGHPYGAQVSRYEHDGGAYGMGGARQVSYGLSMSPDDHLMPLNGKRPRSAPRVLSSQPRIFACAQCPARFARNHDLKRHQRGHLSVRPYPCTWCGKSFSRKDALKRHVLVKGCGKDKKGGGSNGGSGNGTARKSSSGEEGGTDRSRSDAAGDRDDDENSDGEEEEDDHGEEHRSDGYALDAHPLYAGQIACRQDQRSYPPMHAAVDQKPVHYPRPHYTPDDGAYRYGKPSLVSSLASQATASMRAGDFAGAASSFAGFTVARRPSASIA